MKNVQLIDVMGHRAAIGAEIDQNLARVVESGQFIMGPDVAAFEQELADFVDIENVVSCGNGTDALVMALMAADIGPGDAVVVPSFTFVATAEAVSLVGATPVFADCVARSYQLDANSARAAGEKALAQGLRVAALIPVALFGQTGDYEAYRSIADHFGAVLIDDAAQGLGARTPLGVVGSLADITTTSFFPAKPLGCYGDGGAVLTADDETAARLRSIRVHGKGTHKYDNVRIGTNSRLDTVQACVLRPKLQIFAEEIEARNECAERYIEALRDVVTVPEVSDGCIPTWAQFTIRTSRRDELQKFLTERGVGNAIYYPRPLHKQSAYSAENSLSPVSLEATEELADTVLSLPMHPYLSVEDQDHVVDAVVAFFENA